YALYLKQQLPIPKAQELPFRHLQCTACTFCGACMHICPTQALEIKNEPEEKQLLFHPELCINCNLCNAICMQHGLTWENFMTAEQFVQSPTLLAHSQEHICSQCEHEFYQWPSASDSAELRCAFCR
ncbi:MAG: 4Fe-4S dicluster domain-containing protein, partial [Peptococcaceae bacterium]|nr:4Fe-4S dicluster domain-containing protein [Peptococcaceae bacterium]